MPRKARIDAPGALHHIIGRGIERRKIFRDDIDRDNFLRRLGCVLTDTQTPCYAWALIPNHFHLLLRTGTAPIATVMRKLLTGYAVSFNHRHRRNGHLFQNRYKSILCQENIYLLELVRYIHLNPLRTKLVDSLNGLDRYGYSGHSVLIGKNKAEWQDVNKVLGLFGKKASSASKQYRNYVKKGIDQGRRPELIGGGLIRSSGGWQAFKALRKMRIHVKGDERILGNSDFVLEVLKQQDEHMERRYQLQAQGYDIEKAIARVSDLFSLSKQQIISPSRQLHRVKARSVLCYWAVRELGMSGSAVAQVLNIGQPAVSRAVGRGEKLANDMKIKLIK
jgi:REP element-mobilizing transposase RayT